MPELPKNIKIKEVWKKVKNYPKYEVSNLGKIKRNNKILKPIKTQKNYLQINLSENGEAKTYFLHRIILKTFVLNLGRKPCVNHIDNNPINNNLNNLEWCTERENRLHCIKQNRQAGQPKGEKNTNAKLKNKDVIEIRKMKINGISTIRIAKKFNMHRETIRMLLKGMTWKNI